MQTWVQSCHPREKAEETDQSSTPPETSAWNKNHLRFKHKLKDLQKENADLLEADPGKCEELTTNVWASRKSLLVVRTEIPGLATKATQASELQKALTLYMIQDRYPKSTWTHVFTDGSAENAVRNGGSGAYIRRSDGTTSSLSIPASGWPELQLQSRRSRPESCHRTPDWGRLQPAEFVLLSDSLSALQSLTNGPLTFAPSSYTTASVLCQTTE